MRTWAYWAVALGLAGCTSSTPDFDLIPYASGDRWGFINWEGKIVINPQFESAHAFSSGRALVSKKTRYGFVGPDGILALPIQYENATDFSAEGIAWVANLGEPLQAIDSKGNVLFTCESCDYAMKFYNGMSRFAVTEDDELRYGYLNSEGQVQLPAKYKSASPFCEGLAIVGNEDGEYGFIDREGKLVINHQFEDAFPFNANGEAMVKQGDQWGVVNKSGQYKINPQFELLRYGPNGTYYAFDGSEWGIVSSEGAYVANPQFEDVTSTTAVPAPFRSEDEWGFIDEKGTIVINPQFELVSEFYDGFALAKGSDGWGIIDEKGQFTTNPQFDEVLPFPIPEQWVHQNKYYREALYEDYGKPSNFITSLDYDKQAYAEAIAQHLAEFIDPETTIADLLDRYDAYSKQGFIAGYFGQEKTLAKEKYLDGDLEISLNISNRGSYSVERRSVYNGWYNETREEKVFNDGAKIEEGTLKIELFHTPLYRYVGPLMETVIVKELLDKKWDVEVYDKEYAEESGALVGCHFNYGGKTFLLRSTYGFIYLSIED